MPGKIVFDFDGTLADTFEQNLKLIRRVRPNLKEKEIEIYREKGARALKKKLNIPIKEFLRLIIETRKRQNEIIDEVAEFKGIKSLINELRKNKIEVGILSSNSKNNIEKWLKRKKIQVDWVRSESTIFGKEKAIIKIKKRNLIYVGDEIRDIEACKKIGVKMVAVSWGYNYKRALINAGADYVVDTVTELRNLLLSLSQ